MGRRAAAISMRERDPVEPPTHVRHRRGVAGVERRTTESTARPRSTNRRHCVRLGQLCGVTRLRSARRAAAPSTAARPRPTGACGSLPAREGSTVVAQTGRRPTHRPPPQRARSCRSAAASSDDSAPGQGVATMSRPRHRGHAEDAGKLAQRLRRARSAGRGRSTRHPPGYRGRSRRATSIARRVFPIPPGPVRVTSRLASEELASPPGARAPDRRTRSGWPAGCPGAREARGRDGSPAAGCSR